MKYGTMRLVAGAALVVSAVALTVTAYGQGAHQHGDAKPRGGTQATPAPPRAITMEELHRYGGVPRGWKFTLPQGGDAARGRQLFADLECAKCHRGQAAGTSDPGNAGPDLSSMGGHHPAEYFAESIIAPNHVVVAGPGFTGPDGRSIMPSYADSLSVTQLLDLVAFIKSQDGGEHAHGDDAVRERVAGPYRVRLEFRPAAEHAHGGHQHDGGQQHGAGHGGHGATGGDARHAPRTAAAGHLMAFVADADSGDPIPYLPVSAAIHAPGAPPRTVKLIPMLGRDGFHYGADASLPAKTQRVVLTIGVPTLHVMGPARSRFARSQTVPFDWSEGAK